MSIVSYEQRILDALRAVIDPELGVNVVDLGLVYSAVALPNGDIAVQMTMTTPLCPLSAHLRAEAQSALRRAFPDVRVIDVQIVWEPPWDPSMMSDRARRALGWRE